MKLYKPGKTVTIKPIIRQRPFFAKGHDGEHTYTGCEKVYQLPWSMSKGGFVNIFEDKAEQEFFEKELALETGALNLYKREDNSFWVRTKVTLSKEGDVYDLGNPTHCINLGILLATGFLAPSWADRNKRPEYQFAVYDEKEEISNYITIADKNLKAFELLQEMRGNNKIMFNTLRLLGIKLEASAEGKSDVLTAELMRVIDQKAKVAGLPNIDSFIAVATDPKSKVKLLVLDSIDAENIVFENEIYKFEYNKAPIGTSMEEVVLYLSKAENQEQKIMLEAKLKNK